MSKTRFIAVTALIMLGGSSNAWAQDFCREFTSTVTIGNRIQESVGTACLNPDGSWQIVSGNNTGATFYDNGPNSYGSNNVTYIQQPNVTYIQPQPVNYMWRERVYVPSSTIIINRGYNRPQHYGHSYHQRPWGWQQGRGHGRPHGGHHHSHHGGHRNHR
jgi:hypothetical protein